MKRALLLLLVPTLAVAMETQVLPQGAISVDVGYLRTALDKQWSGDRRALSLIDDIPRYEPGGGLQGILRAKPVAEFDFLLVSALYGITDSLSVGVNVPILMRSTIATNLSWEPGDYQPQLGRAYSLEDFWSWADSMGQPRVTGRDVNTQFRVADIVLGAKYLLPRSAWMKENHFRWSAQLNVALPTGSNADPEEAVSVGTNLWELHAAGDVEAHVSADKHFFVDDHGIYRLNVGADVFYAFFRPRLYTAGKGLKNPLLNNNAFFVGDTYWIDPGDWVAGTVSVDVVPFIGPTFASIVSGGSLEKAHALPPMLTLSASYTYIATMQSDWQSNSPLWDWDREKLWKAGEKNIFKFTGTISFFRLGVPVQLYASYRTQDIIPGRYTRPANVFTGGVRAVVKFW
ncbi:MAG: hypothetical protein Q8S33_19565 [Myxococcales bacterium]|nr:hypothetical protein [Myxococcales bacterium]